MAFDLLLTPISFARRKLRAGSQSSSILSLIAATVGAGCLTFPYQVWQLGAGLGPIMIVAGAIISYYAGMFLVEASNHTRRHRYEDIVETMYGKKWSRIASFCNLACLLGYAMAFIVYVRSSILIDFIAKKEFASNIQQVYRIAHLYAA